MEIEFYQKIKAEHSLLTFLNQEFRFFIYEKHMSHNIEYVTFLKFYL